MIVFIKLAIHALYIIHTRFIYRTANLQCEKMIRGNRKHTSFNHSNCAKYLNWIGVKMFIEIPNRYCSNQTICSKCYRFGLIRCDSIILFCWKLIERVACIVIVDTIMGIFGKESFSRCCGKKIVVSFTFHMIQIR